MAFGKESNKLRFSIIFKSPHIYRKVFTDEYHPCWYFPRTDTEADGVSPLIYAISSRDQFKLIGIDEN